MQLEPIPLVIIAQAVAYGIVNLLYILMRYLPLVRIAFGYVAYLLQHLILVGQQQCRRAYLTLFLLYVTFIVLAVNAVYKSFLRKVVTQLAVFYPPNLIPLEEIHKYSDAHYKHKHKSHYHHVHIAAAKLGVLLQQLYDVIAAGYRVARLGLGHILLAHLPVVALILSLIQLEVFVRRLYVARLLVG